MPPLISLSADPPSQGTCSAASRASNLEVFHWTRFDPFTTKDVGVLPYSLGGHNGALSFLGWLGLSKSLVVVSPLFQHCLESSLSSSPNQVVPPVIVAL